MDLRITLLALFLPSFILAQTIPDHRKVDWSQAGNTIEIQSPSQVIDIMNVGGISNQLASNNTAIQAALVQLNGEAGSIYFPDGVYLFDQTVSLPDSTWLVGESSNAKLVFELSGNGHCIQMVGTETTDTVWLNYAIGKGEIEMSVGNAASLSSGEMLRIGMSDEDLVASEWAEGFVGQCVMIDWINGNSIFLQDPLNLDLELVRVPYGIRVIPRVYAGIECLSIERLDDAASHFDNIIACLLYTSPSPRD